MSLQFNRRKFLQAAAVTAASLSFTKVVNAQTTTAFAPKDFIPMGSFNNTKTVTGGVCEMCFWRCQLVGKVRDERLVKIEGNPKSIDNGKSICARGNAGIKLLYDPDRLKYPLKNVGERGKPQWKRISWEEALDECGTKLKQVMDKYGNHSIAMFPHGSSAKYPMDFFEMTVGTPNISEASFFQCRGVRDMAYISTFGQGCDEDVDMANAKTIFLTGSHLGENIHVSHVKKYLKGLAKGAFLIVADPRFSASAAKADMWLQIKPGTDTAFLISIMNYLIENNLYNKVFVKENCSGFEEFKKACSEWTVDKASKECEIPKEQIIKTAQKLAKDAPNVSIHPGRFSSWHGNDFQRARALACLTALLGAYKVKGGLVKPKSPKTASVKWPEHEHDSKFDLSGKWPFKPPGTPTEAIMDAAISEKPYPIKAMAIWGQNMTQALPNQPKTIKALKNQDFVLCVDVMPTDVTMYADILLPEVTYMERYDVIKKGMQYDLSDKNMLYLAARMPLVQPMYECKDSVWITNEIAKRIGFEKDIPVNTSEEYMDKMLAPLELSIAKLREMDGIYLKEGKSAYNEKNEKLEFDTPSGKIELFSKDLADKGFPGAPKYIQATKRPKGYAQLLSGRVPVHSFSRTQNNEWLAQEMPENPLWLNNKAAEKMGLKTGDVISLVNDDGVVSDTKTVVLTTPGIREDSVFLAHGYGMKNPLLKIAANKGLDNQTLNTKPTVDPEAGSHGLRNSFVKIIKDGKTIDFPV